ncbi:SGNH/GDSL hydrolase family protein [bacterium]|nr:SGNH/GDSL hydrolase family protein [bacterium]
MENIKITIIGNSVALRTRPRIEYPGQFNYCQLLEKMLCDQFPDKSIQLKILASGGSTILDIVNNMDQYISTFPDFFIINIGVVDASTREIPLWFFKIKNRKGDRFFDVSFRKIYYHVIKPMRPFLVNIRGRRSWTSKKRFMKLFDQLLECLYKETNSKIIVLPINVTTSRIKKQLPGSEKKYFEYNQIMHNVAKEYNQCFVQLADLKPEIHCPDGVHYSLEGHKIVSQRIFNEILKYS